MSKKVTVREAIEELGITRVTIYRWFKKGLKKYSSFRGMMHIWLVDMDEVYQFIEEQRQKVSK